VSFWQGLAQRDDASHLEHRIGDFRLVDGFRPAHHRRLIESFGNAWAGRCAVLGYGAAPMQF
jgi:hypothetical protein